MKPGDLVRLTPGAASKYFAYYFTWEMLVVDIVHKMEGVGIPPSVQVFYHGKLNSYPMNDLEVVSEVGSS